MDGCAALTPSSLVKENIVEPSGNENHNVATDYDEVRSDVKESQDRSLEALQSANAPDARSVVTELDEADGLDEGLTPCLVPATPPER